MTGQQEWLPRISLPFSRFLENEIGHLNVVKAEIDSMVGHGHWFDLMEFSLDQ